MVIRIILILFWLLTSAFSQEFNPSKKLESSVHLHNYSKGLNYLENHQFELAQKYLNQALLSSSIDSLSKFNVHKSLGKIHYLTNQFHKAEQELLKAIRCFNGPHSNYEISGALVILGNTYDELGQYSKALYWLKKAEIIRTQNDSKIPLAHVLLNIGVVYDNLEDYTQALNYYIKAKTIYAQNKNERGLSKCQNNLANIYKNQEFYDKALSEYLRSLKYHQSQNNFKQIAMLYTNMAILHRYQGDRKREFEYYEEAIKIYRKNNDKKGESTVYLNKGNSFLEINKLNKSRNLLLKSIKLKEEIGDQKGILFCSISLANSYFNEKDYKNSIQYTKRAEKIALDLNLNQSKIDIYKLFLKIYSAKNEHTKAIELYKNQAKLLNAKHETNTIKRLSEIELNEHKLISKTLQNEVVQSEKKIVHFERQQVWLFAICFVFIIVSLILIFSYKIKTLKAVNKSITTEQNLLRAQMSPHFTFNALAVLQGIILNKEYNKSVVFLSKFSKLLRFNLANSSFEYVQIKDELKSVETYIELRNLSSTHNTKFKIVSSLKNEESRIYIPTMLIQPFIENAIDHGFNPVSESDQISVSLSFIENNLVCCIKDNGIGFEPNTKLSLNKDRIHAQEIIEKRLKLLCKKHKQIFRFELKKLNSKGTSVIFNIPYKIYKND